MAEIDYFWKVGTTLRHNIPVEVFVLIQKTSESQERALSKEKICFIRTRLLENANLLSICKNGLE